MINRPTDISNCQIWLDASDTSTLYSNFAIVRQNLITNYFSSFNFWTKTAATTNIGVTADVISNPINSLVNADVVSVSAVGTSNGAIYTSVTLAPTAYTFSIFLKPNTLSAVRLDFSRNAPIPSNEGATCTYDLNTGTLSGSIINYGNTTSTATITPSSAGWYYCTLTISNTATNTYSPQIRLPDVGSIFAYGAQVELSSTSVGSFNEIQTTLSGTQISANLEPVGYFGDKSGNNRHFTGVNGSTITRPFWLSSLSAIKFDGIDDYLTSYSNITYTSQTVYMVCAPLVFGTNNRLYSQISNADPFAFDYWGSNSYIPLYMLSPLNTIGSYASNAPTAGFTFKALSAFDIIGNFHTGTNITNTRNGKEVSSSASHTLGTFVSTQQRIGSAAANSGVGNFCNINIAEVIVYNKALSNIEREDVENYLIRKWSFLNAIPRFVYAIQNGNWSNSTTWSISAEPAPWNFPISADNVYSNTFTVTADSSTRVSTIQNTALSPTIAAGGSFILSNGVSLSSTLRGAVSPCLVTFNPNTTATLVGDLFPLTTTSPLVSCKNNSVLRIFGNLNSSSGGPLLINNSGCNLTVNGNVVNSNNNFNCMENYGTCTIFGNVSGGVSKSSGGLLNNLGTLNVFGNVVSDRTQFELTTIRANGIQNVVGNTFFNATPSPNQGGLFAGKYGETVTLNLTGNLGSGSINIYNGGFIVNVVGNVIPDYGADCIGGEPMNGPFVVNITDGNAGVNNLGGAAVSFVRNYTHKNGTVFANNLRSAITSYSNSLTAVLSGVNIINAPNGRQAIYAPTILTFPGTSATYTRHAVNGYDSYVDYWTSNATFTYPASSDVVSNTTYNNNALTGSMALPSPSAVFLNCPVGSTATTIFQITTGNRYLITSNPLNTNFVLAGASSNTPGTIFTATSTVSFSTPITAYNSDTGRVVPLGTSTPPTVDSFWNRALSELTLPSNTVGGKLKNVVTTQQLSSIYTGLIYTVPGNF